MWLMLMSHLLNAVFPLDVRHDEQGLGNVRKVGVSTVVQLVSRVLSLIVRIRES